VVWVCWDILNLVLWGIEVAQVFILGLLGILLLLDLTKRALAEIRLHLLGDDRWGYLRGISVVVWWLLVMKLPMVQRRGLVKLWNWIGNLVHGQLGQRCLNIVLRQIYILSKQLIYNNLVTGSAWGVRICHRYGLVVQIGVWSFLVLLSALVDGYIIRFVRQNCWDIRDREWDVLIRHRRTDSINKVEYFYFLIKFYQRLILLLHFLH